MIKVGVFYPNNEGSKFDMAYYLQKHLPMVRQKLGPALKGLAVEQGVSGGVPGTPMTYRVICHLSFDSIVAFQAAFEPEMQSIMGDIANYTDIQPTVQISEVRL